MHVVLACLVRLRTPTTATPCSRPWRPRHHRGRQHSLPLLRRLEKQGLLTSEWNTDERAPQVLPHEPHGRCPRPLLTDDWHRLDDAVARLTNGDPR